LERLIGHGADPRDARPFGRLFLPDNDRVVAGFGLTFSPPKTLSVLWGTAGEAVSTAVLTAHKRSAEIALSVLEHHAAFTRTSSGGVFQVDTDGFVAAALTHRTSRAADPQLHTHVLVAHKGCVPDGRWRARCPRALLAPEGHRDALQGGACAELSTSLGVRWTAVDENGIAEIEGVPQVLVETWSSRRKAVEEMGSQLAAQREADLGRALSPSERATAYQLAAYRTRAPKFDADTSTTELVVRRRTETASWGQEPERWLPGVLGHELVAPTMDASEIMRATIDRLEETKAMWGRSDVVEVLSTLVQATSGEELRAEIELLADAVLRHDEVCSLAAPLPAEPPQALHRADGMSAIERHGAIRYTTLGREGRVLDAVRGYEGAGLGVIPGDITDAVLSTSVLGEDQRRAVRELLGSGDQVALLVGPAGAGKSRALRGARRLAARRH
jgi:conjugative relaxase-like TrwC/TraI family protein